MLTSSLLWLLVTLSAFGTSVLSGIVGMAGGMMLMFVLISVLPVSSAMILHAATQLTANGSRAWMLREHVLWRLLPPYLLGSAVAIAIATFLVLIPDPAWVLILIGLFAWGGRWSKHLRGLDITRPLITVVCGFSSLLLSFLLGPRGPCWTFFISTAVSAAKASSPTKPSLRPSDIHCASSTTACWLMSIAGWYGGFSPLPSLAILGTRAGVVILARWHDVGFQRISLKSF